MKRNISWITNELVSHNDGHSWLWILWKRYGRFRISFSRRLTKGAIITLTICDTNVHTCESIKTYLCEAFRSPIPVSFHHAGEELGISSKAKRKSGKIKKDLTDAINYYCLPTQARPPGLIQFSGTLAFLLGFPSLIVSLLCSHSDLHSDVYRVLGRASGGLMLCH